MYKNVIIHMFIDNLMKLHTIVVNIVENVYSWIDQFSFDTLINDILQINLNTQFFTNVDNLSQERRPCTWTLTPTFDIELFKSILQNLIDGSQKKKHGKHD